MATMTTMMVRPANFWWHDVRRSERHHLRWMMSNIQKTVCSRGDIRLLVVSASGHLGGTCADSRQMTVVWVNSRAGNSNNIWQYLVTKVSRQDKDCSAETGRRLRVWAVLQMTKIQLITSNYALTYEQLLNPKLNSINKKDKSLETLYHNTYFYTRVWKCMFSVYPLL